jgi:NitT/TauT family transport system substrate-binding protein
VRSPDASALVLLGVPFDCPEDHTAYREALVNSMATYSTNDRMPVQGPESVRKALAASLGTVRTGQIDLAKTYTDEFLTNQ